MTKNSQSGANNPAASPLHEEKATMRILIVSDIHGNFPALEAVAKQCGDVDLILNGGDTTVYAPFPNQTIDWLRTHRAVSILGNTDRHILTLLAGDTFTHPKKAEKRIMYGATAAELSKENGAWLKSQPLWRTIDHAAEDDGRHLPKIGLFHGSPVNPDGFLFADTPDSRFAELAGATDHDIIIVGHSHSPFHKHINGVHFINPGSVGRMFDGSPTASCAVLELSGEDIAVSHLRLDYKVEAVAAELTRLRYPAIYARMYRIGRKLN